MDFGELVCGPDGEDDQEDEAGEGPSTARRPRSPEWRRNIDHHNMSHMAKASRILGSEVRHTNGGLAMREPIRRPAWGAEKECFEAIWSAFSSGGGRGGWGIFV